MNKRLYKEIERIEDNYFGFESISRAEIIEIIEHFYNLALKDVTEELEKRIAAGTSKYDMSAEAVALDSFLDFVDQLKK